MHLHGVAHLSKKNNPPESQETCMLFLFVRVNVPAGGPTDCWLTPFNSHHVQVAGISKTRKGMCETLGDLLIKIPELVELVGLASPDKWTPSGSTCHYELGFFLPLKDDSWWAHRWSSGKTMTFYFILIKFWLDSLKNALGPVFLSGSLSLCPHGYVECFVFCFTLRKSYGTYVQGCTAWVQ